MKIRFHKVVAGVLLAILITLGANFYLRLGIWGLADQRAKTAFIAALGLVLVYVIFFIPRRAEIEEDNEAKLKAKGNIN